MSKSSKMNDQEGIISLINTSNVAMIKKLYLHVPHEITELINSISINHRNDLFNSEIMISWMLDNMELDSKILSLMFDHVLKKCRQPPISKTMKQITSQLIDMGSSTLHSDLLLLLPADDFFNYISKIEYFINGKNLEWLFHDKVEKKVRDYVYNLIIQLDLHVDDMFSILNCALFYVKREHDDQIAGLIEIASTRIFFNELIYSIICCRFNHEIDKYISPYYFYDEMMFLQKILHIRQILRCQQKLSEDLENLLSSIKSNDDANKLYETVSIICHAPSKIVYDERMQNVIQN